MYSQHFDAFATTLKVEQCQNLSATHVENALQKQDRNLQDLMALLSPAAVPYLETMAQKAHALTTQRFGRTMQLFMPMYLSNLCYNSCTYCGFSMENKYERIILSNQEIVDEAKLLHDKGIRHILLLTGEAERKVGVDFLENAIRLVKPFFSSIGIEVQPLEQHEYERLIQAGADSLTVYQETYHPEWYKTYHIRGKKRDFTYRLDTCDRGGKAGFYQMNIGALFGLYEWRYEALALADHLHYLQKTHWQSRYAISFPRIKDMVGEFEVKHPATDQDIVQFICAFRLVFPDLGITLSTREPAALRDNLIPLGITSMSAESNTAPGGYSEKEGSEKQFEISDHRSLDQIKALLQNKGYDPVTKDWVHAV